MDPESISLMVDKNRSRILQWTESLIRFPSENRPPDGNEGEAQRFIEEECRALGFEVDSFRPDSVPDIENHPYWLTGRNYPDERKNVVARWKGSGGGRSILLSGHIDVAPREPGKWEVTSPFEPLLRNGRLYGRGSADLKGGIAAAYWAIRILVELGFKPGGDILFESVVDEEYAGGNGTLASRLKGYNADLGILTEPTRMEVCPASLGAFLGNITLKGKAGVPYMGSKITNPVHGISRVIQLFSEWEENWRRGNSHPLFKGQDKQLKILLWNLDTGPEGEFIQLGAPMAVRLSWVVWCYPGMGEEEFYRGFRKYWEEAGMDEELRHYRIEIIPEYHFVRPWETDPSTEAVQVVLDAWQEYTGERPSIGGASFSCDLAIYGDVGKMPCVIIGPRGDNLHAPDEWVQVEDIYSLTGIFASIISRWCSR